MRSKAGVTPEAAIACVVLMVLVLLGSLPAWRRPGTVSRKVEILIAVVVQAGVIILALVLFGKR